MLQAVEAIIREGRIQPVEPISMEESALFAYPSATNHHTPRYIICPPSW